MSAPTVNQLRALARTPIEGEALWILGGLYTFKAVNAETGAYTLCEVKGPDGYAIPIHYHDAEEEGFYVVDGEVTIFLEDDERRLGPGAFAFAPRGVRHAFRLESPEAVLLVIPSPGPAHEAMFREMGEPAPERVVPPPTEAVPDATGLAATAARYGTQIVGPPPVRE